MHVVFITHNYPRWAGDTAGVFLEPLAHALVQRDHRVTVVVPSHGGESGRIQRQGVTIDRVRYSWKANERWAGTGAMAASIRSLPGLCGIVGMWYALRHAARAYGGADAILHAHWWVPAGIACPARAPFVLTVHGSDARLLDRPGLIAGIGCRTVKRATIVTTVSHALADTVSQRCGRLVPPEHIIPMPIEPHTIPQSRGGGGGVVITRLTEQKRVDLILDAIAVLSRSGGLQVRLRVVGGGPAENDLRARVVRLGVERLVTFTGTQSPGEARKELQTADWSVAAGVGEGLGLTAVEALIAGVPVVACTDGGGILDVVPTSGGGRVVAPTPEGVAQGIRELLSDSAAPIDARRRGGHWRAELAPEVVAKRFEGIYAQVRRA